MTSASVGFQCPECLREGQSSVRRPSKVKNAGVSIHRVGVVTSVLIALNIAMFIATAINARSLTNNTAGSLTTALYLDPFYVDQGEWWRVLTSAFLHQGPFHVAINMLALYMLGPQLEEFFGKVRYTILYLLSGIGASIAVLIVNQAAVGASGAIFGLLGGLAAVLLFQKRGLQPLVPVLILNLMISLIPGISLAAHVGGFITGVIVTFAMLYGAKLSRSRGK